MAAIVTPTIRTPLLAGEGGSAGRSPVRTSPAPTTKDWWMYWDALTRAANQNTAEIAAIEELIAAAVRIGTHDERLAVDPAPIGALWMESDRDNVIYQAQTVAGEPQWVYLTGAMYGTVIAVDQRPADLGVNDAGFIFLSSDSTSVRWSGTVWEALGRVLDLGAAPTQSQLVLKADGLGALSMLCYSDSNQQIHFGCEFVDSQMIARSTELARILRTAGALAVQAATGQTPGTVITGEATLVYIDLVNRRVGINLVGASYPLDVVGDVNTSTVYRVGGTQVVGARGAGLTASGLAVAAPPAAYNPAYETTVGNLANNLKVRLDELELRLKAHGLIA